MAMENTGAVINKKNHPRAICGTVAHQSHGREITTGCEKCLDFCLLHLHAQALHKGCTLVCEGLGRLTGLLLSALLLPRWWPAFCASLQTHSL